MGETLWNLMGTAISVLIFYVLKNREI